ncbi:MAG: hypothetical protein ACLUGJ_11570 [Blautia wexlerae]
MDSGYFPQDQAEPRKMAAEKRGSLKGSAIESLIFCAVMAWVIWFYGWYKMHNTGYGHTDEETHLYWIGALIHGNMFPAGMYPHGVHTLNAALGILFPLEMLPGFT